MVAETRLSVAGLQEVDGLLEKAAQYLPADRLPAIRTAYDFARDSHAGQFRKSGEPYLIHPLNAAGIVADLRLDEDSIIAALLHDVCEDCGVPPSEIEERFGADVQTLVDGVTKLGRLTTSPEMLVVGDDAAYQAENLRKMFVAMAQDIRVVLIKLADRLHNMRTLGALKEHRQRAIARETMEIYAPLAHRLGIWQMKWELEDLAFRYLEPEKFHHVESLVAAQREGQEHYIAQMIVLLEEELGKAGLTAEVTGRSKHLYSVYKKIEKYTAQGKDFSQIHDLLAVRVLVDSVAECYTALGVVHGLWRPIHGQFDDYIATPRDSGYQSLHTTVYAVGNRPLEIQIRTHDMHRVAEYGIAAHWRYKEGGRRNGKFEEQISWLRQLLEWHREVGSSQAFVESVKTDLFRDQVFVVTPKGEIKDLPAGATPLDFAYRIHTDVGHRCIGAKVNGKLVPLDYQLQNGDVVYILSSKTAKGPSLDWLNPSVGYVRTSNAREKIRQWFRKQERTENVVRGKELMEKERRRLGLRQDDQDLAKLLKFERPEDLYAALGSGDLSVQAIATRVSLQGIAEPEPKLPTTSPQGPVSGAVQVLGVGDLLTRVAQCCNPVPGDPIVGYITRSRGVTVHRADCTNLTDEAAQDRLIEVSWGAQGQQMYPVPVVIEGWDRVGLLRDITTVLAGEKVNIGSVNVVTHDDHTATLHLLINAADVSQLSHILSRLETIRGVMSVSRAMEPARG